MRKLTMLIALVFISYDFMAQDCSICSEPLKYEYFTDQSAKEVHIAYLETINQQNYRVKKSGVGAKLSVVYSGIPINFSGDYNSFNQSRSSYFQRINHTYDESQSESRFRQVMNNNGFKSFNNCIDACMGKPGLFIYLKHNLEQQAAFYVKYNGDPNNPAKLKRSKVTNASKSDKLNGTKLYPNGEETFTFTKKRITDTSLVILNSNVGRTATLPILPPTPTNHPNPVECPSIYVKHFVSDWSPSAQHPEHQLSVPNEYKILGGGAEVIETSVGNLIIESYPINSQTWKVKAKDHMTPSVTKIKVHVMALYDPNDNFDVSITHATDGQPSQRPRVHIDVENGYTMTGGGAKVNWIGAGQLLIASYPEDQDTWHVASKDHQAGNLATITGYAIGIKARQDSCPILSEISVETSGMAQHPNGTVRLSDNSYTLTGGGVNVIERGAGSLLYQSYPIFGEKETELTQQWFGKAKDHNIPVLTNIQVYVIGIKVASDKYAVFANEY